MAKTKVYVYIGRFQPFHNAHAYVIDRAASIADRVIVLIGSAYQARTIKNPFTYEERENVIREYLSRHDVMSQIRPVRDQPYNDTKWIQTVQEQVENALLSYGDTISECEIVITGSDRDSSTWYLNAFPQWKQDLVPPVPQGRDLNATGIRKALFEAGNIELVKDDLPQVSQDFVKGMFIGSEWHRRLSKQSKILQDGKNAWSNTPYPVIFQTVDAVVIQSGHVLVVERKSEPGAGLWALPGGFLNPQEWLRDAAIRELEEETKIKLPTATLRNAIRAREIFDDPNRSLRGRTITVAHLIRLDDTKPLPKVKGSDDAARAFWVPLNEARANSEMWFEDHLSILDWAVGVKDRT